MCRITPLSVLIMRKTWTVHDTTLRGEEKKREQERRRTLLPTCVTSSLWSPPYGLGQTIRPSTLDKLSFVTFQKGLTIYFQKVLFFHIFRLTIICN